jgi:4-amino-4-deoxy-L-arabinose transferase-like glycosyltransferase
MLFDPANSTASLPARSPLGALSGLLQSVSALFEYTRPDIRDRAIHGWWLIGLMFAGGWVRFWGLGEVGLHGDEETMALAVQHILIDGRPILPSGMFYPRGMTQLYLMAASTSIFGESEWALRLPSALCGIALIGSAYLVGRRFLRPEWNLALVATVAFLPELIVYSQTARMYIFLVTCMTVSMVCVFEWERTDRIAWLIAAVAALIVGIDMQLLAVSGVLIFLLPGLLQGDTRKLTYGGCAAAVGIIGFVIINNWTNAQYPVPPPEFAADFAPPPWERSWAPQEFALTIDVALLVSGVAIVFFALHFVRFVAVRSAAVASALLLLAGVVLQLAMFYHLAMLCYLVGVLLACRYRSAALISRIPFLLLAIGTMALIHTSLLMSTQGSVIKIVGALVGQPSVWPYVRVAQLSEAAGLLTAGLLAFGLFRLAQGKRVTDYWLLALAGVFAPVFAIGLFAWNVPARYTAGSLMPMLLCAFAFAQYGADWLLPRIRQSFAGVKPHAIAASLVALCAVKPAAVADVVDAGYRIHPDHKGAAEFMRSLPITEDDVVLAEDVLQQTYYLGAVDYWLIGPQVARRYIKSTDNGVVDFYTGTPVIVTSAMLDKVLRENAGKRIFVIGSGESQRNQRRSVRGDDLHAAIESDRFEPIYLGRDGLTRVLRARSDRVGLPSMRDAASESKVSVAAKSVEAAKPKTLAR